MYSQYPAQNIALRAISDTVKSLKLAASRQDAEAKLDGSFEEIKRICARTVD
jgi:hypothetical protein